jgi:hypothetical protein
MHTNKSECKFLFFENLNFTTSFYCCHRGNESKFLVKIMTQSGYTWNSYISVTTICKNTGKISRRFSFYTLSVLLLGQDHGTYHPWIVD